MTRYWNTLTGDLQKLYCNLSVDENGAEEYHDRDDLVPVKPIFLRVKSLGCV